jgi:hypothetical protein
VAQLHLAFSSPVAPVERQYEGKLSNRIGELNRLAILIRQFEVRKTLADLQFHAHTSLAMWDLRISLGHFGEEAFFFQLLQQ